MRSKIPGATIILLFALFSFKPTPGLEQPTVGATVPDFQLTATNGKTVSLADYNDAKGFIVVFMSNTCEVSKTYERTLNELNLAYTSKGFPVIAINSTDSAMDKAQKNSLESMKARAEKKHYSFPYLSDPTQKVARDYKVEHTPYAYLIEKTNGAYTLRYIGAIDGRDVDGRMMSDRYLADAVDAVLAGNNPMYMATEEVGCNIDFKKLN